VNRKNVKIFIPFLLFCCLCYLTKAQQLNIKNFSIDEGLPQSQVIGLFQDHTRIIWCATNGGGVSRFDGVKFHNLNTKDGLNSNRVNAVFEDRNHTVWIASAKGLNKYVQGKLLKVDEEIINQQAVYKIYQNSNGEIWFGTAEGIVIYDGKTFSPFIRNDSLGKFQVSAITEDKLGNVWIGTMQNGVFCYDGKSIIHFTEKDGLIDLKNRDILVNGDKIWVATNHGINIYDLSKNYLGKHQFDTLKFDNKPYTQTTYTLYKDSSGVIWVGNGAGVSEINVERAKIKTITKLNGLCNGFITTIIQGKEGNMWFGSFEGGLSKYSNDLFVSISEKDGLANNSVMSIFKDKEDNMWIGTWGGGVSKLNYKAFVNQDTLIFQNYSQQKDGLAYNNIWSICEDKKGNIWFGTSAQGVSVFDGKKFTNYHFKQGLHGVHISALLADKKGNVWIAHEKGIDKYDGKTFTFYGKEKGISEFGVNAIYEDNLGQIWFGSADKIVKYDDGNFISITRPQGFPKIRNIVNDKFGYMWISTDLGVAVFNGTTFKSITETDGLSSNTVYYIQPDEDGNLWMGTNNGIDKLDLNKFVNEKEIVIKHYGKEEGFIGVECNQNSFYKDIDGKLWIGTVAGITIYDPRKEKKNMIEPLTQIMGIRLFLENVDLSRYGDSTVNGLPKNLRLPYDKNHITFDFIGICLTNPTMVKYKFMLEGFDTGWLPEGKETSTTYSNLPPGKYTFLLKAANNDGLWNSIPVKYSFEIVPPFWKRPWFFITLTLIIIGSVFVMIKMRERSLRHSQKLLEEQVTIRTYELLEEKEKLQTAYSEIDEKNKDITDSIHYAKRIQQAILPSDTMWKQLLPESFILYKPKAIVSGDFYWLEKWGNQTLVGAVDCTGHGVPGAFMSIVGHNILTQAVNVLGLSKPALILNETNKQLSKKLNQDPDVATVRDGMDIALIAINYPKLKIEFAGANNPLWIIRNNELIQLNGDKFPIGIFVGEELQQFKNHEWELQKDDCIYIFTDGYADQFGGPKGKKFKYKQFQDLLIANHKKPFEEQKIILEKTIEDWIGDLEQIDDILVIGIKI
jgi:ligand-binding sensor domain-containing protein/serine phosphatase RsbU (regulator of sigma subunit)